MWVLSATLVLRGCDVRLQAASSRTIAVVWWIFSLVVIIIYASLVSHWFDPQQHSRPIYSSLDDLLEDPTFEFGVIHGGSTAHYLQNAKREDLQKVWWRVQKSSSEPRSFQQSALSGIEEVQKDMEGKFAFLTEEINLNGALVDDCSLGLVSGIESKAFAIAVAKGGGGGDSLREKLSQGILTLGESGALHQLQEKWWPQRFCKNEDITKNPPQVKLVNFVGPLTVLIVGITLAIFIAMCERLFHHRRSHRGFFRTATSESGNGKIPMNGSNEGSDRDAESEN
jgi:hypothetical protein